MLVVMLDCLIVVSFSFDFQFKLISYGVFVPLFGNGAKLASSLVL